MRPFADCRVPPLGLLGRAAFLAAAVAVLPLLACGSASDRGEAGEAAAYDLSDEHVEYLRSTAGAELELVEPGSDGAWREIRGGGRLVRLAAPPERIASRTLATDEILLEIAEPERIALLSPFADDPAYSPSADAAQRLGRVGGFATEEILAAAPDLVFAAGFNTPETIAQLEAAGLPVLVLLDHQSLAAIENNIRVVGFAIGRDREAERLVQSMRARLRAAQTRAAPAAGLRVVHFSGGVTLGSRTVFNDAIRHLGAVNVAAEQGLVGWPRISAEQIVLWNPDVIFTNEAVAVGAKVGLPDGTRAAGMGNVVALDGRDMAAVSHHVAGLVERLADALAQAAERMAAAEGGSRQPVDSE